MGVSRLVLRPALVALLAAGAFAPAAAADIFAVTDVNAPAPGTDTDIALIDASTGQQLTLPAGIDTSDNETHPSISSDGRRLVFERRNPVTNSRRIVLADLSTGTTADLFTGFEAGSINPTSPSITPDGAGVLTGGQSNGPLLTDVSNFPSGPYPHTALASRSLTFDPTATGTASGSVLAFDQITSGPGGSDVRFGTIGRSLFGSAGIAGAHNAHPTIGSPGGVTTIVFDLAGSTNANATLEACSPVNPLFATCPHEFLPGTRTGGDDSRPAFTPDSRYVGFINRGFTGTSTSPVSHLFVWDSETQTLISSFDLGSPTPDDTGYLSLYERPVLTLAAINPNGIVQFGLRLPANIGILVQRVTGHRTLFGRRVPRLGSAQPVPLGSFKRGRGHARWNLKVRGRRLRPGTYQVTLRALTRSGKVRDLGKPRLLRVRGH